MQLSLFDAPPRPIAVVDPHVDHRDIPQLTRQSRVILERLRQGPATNAELTAVGLRYSARIHELRRAGHEIESEQLGWSLWLFSLRGVEQSPQPNETARS